MSCGGTAMWKQWGLGPVFAFETLVNARRRQIYQVRSLFVLTILIGLIIAWFNNEGSNLTVGLEGVNLSTNGRPRRGVLLHDGRHPDIARDADCTSSHGRVNLHGAPVERSHTC